MVQNAWVAGEGPPPPRMTQWASCHHQAVNKPFASGGLELLHMASSQSQRTGAAGTRSHQADSSRGASPGERQPSDQRESRAAQGSLASLALPRPLPSRLVFAVQGQVCPQQSGGRAETMTHGFQGADGKVEGREPKGPEASRTNMTCWLLYQALSRAIPKVLVGAPGIPGSWVQTGRIPFWGGCSKSPPAPGGSWSPWSTC